MSYQMQPASAYVSSEGFLNPETVVGEFNILPGMKIADFGCGAGHIGILSAQKTGKDGMVTALDIMEDKLESIRARAKAAGLENIETRRANLEVPGSTALADNSQDIVLLINILFQSTLKADILKEAIRVLRQGGSAVLVEWKKSTGGFGPPDNLRSDAQVMGELFTAGGFKEVRTFDAGQFHYGLVFQK